MQASSASSSMQSMFHQASESGQTDADVDGLSALEAHTDFPDVPFARVDLPEVLDVAAPDVEQDKPALVDEEERVEHERPPAEWCVDTGTSLVALTTFELWMALGRGDVDGKTNVWRNGMESWEVAGDVPELSHALEDSFSLLPPPVMPTPTEVMSVKGHERTPFGFGMTDDGNDGEAARSGPISRSKRGRSRGLSKAWFAGGCLAAAAAVALLFVAQSWEAPLSTASVNRKVAVARLEGAMERANRQVAEAVQRRAETEAARAVAPVSSSARQHKEVGQRRARRGRR